MVENAGSTFTTNENVTGFYCWFIKRVIFDSDILIRLWLWFISEGLGWCFLSVCHIYHCAYKSWERSLFSSFFSCGNFELHCSYFLSEQSNICIPVLQDHNQYVVQIATFIRCVYHLHPLMTQWTMALNYHWRYCIMTIVMSLMPSNPIGCCSPVENFSQSEMRKWW